MAYMSQEKKNRLAPKIKEVLNKYGVKGTISVNNYSTLVVTLRSGPLDFDVEYLGNQRGGRDVNYYPHEKIYFGDTREFLKEIYSAMNEGNSSMTNYFDVGWYSQVTLGKWDKPYICTRPFKVLNQGGLIVKLTSSSPKLLDVINTISEEIVEEKIKGGGLQRVLLEEGTIKNWNFGSHLGRKEEEVSLVHIAVGKNQCILYYPMYGIDNRMAELLSVIESELCSIR